MAVEVTIEIQTEGEAYADADIGNYSKKSRNIKISMSFALEKISISKLTIFVTLVTDLNT
jgi:hypothetical protein